MKKIAFLFCLLCMNSALAAEAFVDTNLINEMYTTVTKKYLKPVNLEEIAINGLEALTEIDDKITVTKGSQKLYVYYDKQIKKVIPMPENRESIPQWVDTMQKMISATALISNKIAIKDFSIPDLMMKKITEKLDKYSAYHSEYDYEEQEAENGIYTLFSDRKIDDILYIRVRTFNIQTSQQVQTSLERNKPYSGIVLDMRGNSGGIFDEALKVADFFTDSEIITYTSERNGENTHYYTSKEGSLYEGPMVIIVDGETASAAEVLAGGMQDQSRAKLIGTQTFGKGTIQNVIQMSNGGKLALTTAQFFTPSGKVIHEQGIKPDVCLTLDENNNCLKEEHVWDDTYIEKAIKLLKNEL